MDHASGGHQIDFEDGIPNISLGDQAKGPYGSHTVRQVLSRNSNTPNRQIKQDSMDSEKSGKGLKGAMGIDEIMDGRKSDNFNSHIRYLNHLQRSADSGFASTEVEAQQARLKPLMRQTSVQENKEYEMDMTEICSSKNSSKSELNYKEMSDDNHVRKTIRDDITFRDPIPEIKVQSNFSPKERDRTDMYAIADVPEDFKDQLTEVVTTIAQKHWEKQAYAKEANTNERVMSGNELIQSIKHDLSTATSTFRSQPNLPSPLAQLRQREGLQKGRVSKSGERISVDSFSDIPLPPLNMLAEKSASQNSSPSPPLPTPSPPLPTPPPEMLTDSEDPSFSFSGNAKSSQEDTYRGKKGLGKELPDIAEAPQGISAKIRKPQISRIPAVNASNSPVKHANMGNVQASFDPSIRSKGVKMKHPAVSTVPPNEFGQFYGSEKSQKDHRT